MDPLYLKARKDVRQAAVTAFFVAAVSFALILYAILSDARGPLEALKDPINLLDPLVLIGLGLAVLRYWRGAALALFVYYVVSKVYVALEADRTMGLLIGSVFLYFFWTGIRGSFAYHRLRRRDDLSYQAGPRWHYFVGAPVAGLVFLLLGYGLATEMGVLPSMAVISGEELSDGDRDWLLAQGVLTPGERVELFYSAGLFSIRNHGSLLTDKRVIVYEAWEGEFHQFGVSFEAVVSVEMTQVGNFTRDSLAVVRTRKGEEFTLMLSAEEGGDTRFLGALRKKLP